MPPLNECHTRTKLNSNKHHPQIMTESGKGQNQSYDTAFKQRLLLMWKGWGKGYQLKGLESNDKWLRKWQNLKASIAEIGPKHKRLNGGGKKTVVGADKEEQLVSWIECLRPHNLRMMRHSFQLKAREIRPRCYDGEHDSFSASRGWLEGFSSTICFLCSEEQRLVNICWRTLSPTCYHL